MTAKLFAFYKKHRDTIAYLIMATVLIAPYLDIIFPRVDLRVKLLSAIPLFLLFLLNDWRTETDKRLKRIEQGLNNPEPPTFPRWPSMEDSLLDVMKSFVDRGEKIDVKIIGVSSKFSSPFFQRAITHLLSNPPGKLNLDISIVVTKPETLSEWELAEWERSSRHSIDEIEAFLSRHKKQMEKAGILLSLYEYDNLPHWHGVLFNKEILFMGRTEWYRTGDDNLWQLRVGEVEYRRFEYVDSYGGKTRIERFDHWFRRYLDRAKYLDRVHSNVNLESTANKLLEAE
jgi:hypothetical protein